jgi:hypothetical protein
MELELLQGDEDFDALYRTKKKEFLLTEIAR